MTISHFNDYSLENVYLRTREEQRSEIMALWLEQNIVRDANERARRSHEVVLMVRNAAGELAGLSSVGLYTLADGRIFYNYRMFIRPSDRIPYLMSAVIRRTRDILQNFRHPAGVISGLIAITENPKLMRAGTKRGFQRIGYRYHGKTPQGLDIWVIEFSNGLDK